MFRLNNIITTATTNKQKLNILIVNEEKDEYIKKLCLLDHNFYIAQGSVQNVQWLSKEKPHNLRLVNYLQDCSVGHLDVIVVFNRLGANNTAIQIGADMHVPVIVVDHASSVSKAPLPFFTEIKVHHPESQVLANGNCTIAVNKKVQHSWFNNEQELSLCIPLFATKKENKVKQKILIDPNLSREYLSSLPLSIPPELLTHNIEDAAFYLNLWTNHHSMLFDAMASEVPVVTLGCYELEDIINYEACVRVEDLKIIQDPNFINNLYKFDRLPHVINRAKDYVSEYLISKEEFLNKWNNILLHISSTTYMR